MQIIFPEKKNRSEILKILGEVATANTEADLESFLSVFNPVNNRKKMGEIYKENLGYDPITYFDMSDILKLIDKAMACMSSKTAEAVKTNEELIVNETLKILNKDHASRLKSALAHVISPYLFTTDEKTKVGELLIGESLETDRDDDGDDDDDLSRVEIDDDDDSFDLSDPDIPTLDMGIDDEDLPDPSYDEEE